MFAIPLVLMLTVLAWHIPWNNVLRGFLSWIIQCCFNIAGSSAGVSTKAKQQEQHCLQVAQPGCLPQEHTRRGCCSNFGARFITIVLVISFDFYSTMATYAIGMLMCLELPAGNAPPRQWVLDVRLQCPTRRLDLWWGKWALMLGVVLLTLCFVYPLLIAAVLVTRARNGQLDPDSKSAKESRPAGLWGLITQSSFAANLDFRFADYEVDYDDWIKKQAVLNLVSDKGHPVAGFLGSLRMLLVLTWDSILDLQRLVLAVLGLSVMLHELHQLLLVTIVLVIYLVLMLAVRPWASPAILRLQVLAASVLVLSCCGILASNVSAPGHYSEADRKAYTTALGWTVIGINLFYVVVGVLTLLYCAYHKSSRQGSQWLSTLSKWLKSLPGCLAGVQQHTYGTDFNKV